MVSKKKTATATFLTHQTFSWLTGWLASQTLTIIGFKNKKQNFSFTWPQELTATGSHSSPQVGRQLLRILVGQNQLCHRTLPQTPRCSSGPRSALLLHQLTVDQYQEFALHGPAEYTSCIVCGGSADSSTTTHLNQRLLVAWFAGF